MPPVPYDLIIGLDRGDQKTDLCLLETATGQRRCAVSPGLLVDERKWHRTTRVEQRVAAGTRRAGLEITMDAPHCGSVQRPLMGIASVNLTGTA
jgi:hypothetical protein